MIGKEPATVDPLFLDGLRDKPDQTFPVKLGDKTVTVSLKDIIYDAPKGEFHHPNTMTVQAHGRRRSAARAGVLLSWRRIHRVERIHAAEEESAEVPVRDNEGAAAHADKNKLDDRAGNAGQRDVDRRAGARRKSYAFIDKIINAMVATVKSGLKMPEDDVLPGPIKLHSKAATVYKRAMDEKYQSDRGIGALSACAHGGF